MVVISCFCEHGEKTSTFLVGRRRRCHKTLGTCVYCVPTLCQIAFSFLMLIAILYQGVFLFPDQRNMIKMFLM